MRSRGNCSRRSEEIAVSRTCRSASWRIDMAHIVGLCAKPSRTRSHRRGRRIRRARPAIDEYVAVIDVAHRRRGRPAQATTHRPADLAAAGR